MKRLIKFLTFGCIMMLCVINVKGADINSSEQLTTEVYQFKKVEFKIQLSTSYANPYDAAEIMLDMIIISPSGKNLKLPCYFETGNTTLSEWKARFAPREAGEYSYAFRLTKNGSVIETSENKTFIANPSAKDGFITTRDNWTFIYDSGKPFRGLGENVCWEARSWDNQNYTYEYFLPRLAKNGVNFFRIWMCPWNVPVEWKTVRDTKFYTNSPDYFNPSGVKRLDRLVNLCDSLGLHFMLAIDAHGALMSTGEWPMSNYNVKNGGPAATPKEFFSLPAAREKYKNKIRYLIARWGYSPAIGVWEFFNELDNAVVPENIPHADVTSWHTEMSAYFKANDPYEHPISVSVSHRDITGLNSVPDIDFNQKHIYKATNSIPSTLNSYVNTYKKPYVIGEFGYEWDWNINFATIEKENIHDYKIGLWYGLFNPTPILPMSWWWEWFDARNTHLYFSGVREIMDQMTEAGKGSFEKVTTSFSLDDYSVKCGQTIFVYLHNTSLTAASNKTLTITTNDKLTYSIKAFNPETKVYSDLNAVTADSLLKVENISLNGWEEKILILIPQGITLAKNEPYKGTVSIIPGIIEAENFDEGGEGISFHDLDSINIGNYYRINSGIDIDSINNGYCLSENVPGEWLEYTIKVEKSGAYKLEVGMSGLFVGKAFHLEIGGKDVSGPIMKTAVSNDIDTFTADIPVLKAGDYIIKLVVDGIGFEIDFLKFDLINELPSAELTKPDKDTSLNVDEVPVNFLIQATASDNDGSVSKVEFYINNKLAGSATTAPFEYNASLKEGANVVYVIAYDNNNFSAQSNLRTINIIRNQAAYKGDPWPIPGKIEAEDYDFGGAGVAYFDDAGGNDGGKYRTEDVDIESTTDAGGGFNVGWINAGEWLAYTVNVASSGFYNVEIRVATGMPNGKLSLEIDGTNVSGDIAIATTGGWQKWVSINKVVELPAGKNVLKVVAKGPYNINYLDFSLATAIEKRLVDQISVFPNPVKDLLTIQNLKNGSSVQVVDIFGRVVLKSIFNSEPLDLTSLKSGIYSINIFEKDKISAIKIVKE